MTKDEIRLKYSGLILFVSRLASLVTGLFFTLMLTRTVTETEYGIWGNLSDLTQYFLLIANVIPFWTTRFVAREHKGSAKTGLVVNILISLISITVYLTMIPFATSALQIPHQYVILYTIIAVQIVELYTLMALQGIVYAARPQALGYGLLFHETAKVAIAYLLIIHFNMGLLGGLISLISAYLVQTLVYLNFVEEYLKEKIQLRFVKEWLKGSFLTLYSVVGTQISTFTLIILFIYGTEVGRAYYGASFQIARVVGYSAFLAYALYPKLLAKTNPEDVTTSLRMVLMFAIPMTTGAIFLADSYLTVLRDVYGEATLVLQLLALDVLCISLSQVLQSVILGVEKIDEKAKIPIKQLLRTRLFQTFTLPYVRSTILLSASFYLLTTIAETPLKAATYVAAAYVIADIVVLNCRYAIARKTLLFNLPWKSLGKYVASSAIMAVVLIVVPHPRKLLLTLVVTLMGSTTYVLSLLAMDKETRELVKSIVQEAATKFTNSFSRINSKFPFSHVYGKNHEVESA